MGYIGKSAIFLKSALFERIAIFLTKYLFIGVITKWDIVEKSAIFLKSALFERIAIFLTKYLFIGIITKAKKPLLYSDLILAMSRIDR